MGHNLRARWEGAGTEVVVPVVMGHQECSHRCGTDGRQPGLQLGALRRAVARIDHQRALRCDNGPQPGAGSSDVAGQDPAVFGQALEHQNILS